MELQRSITRGAALARAAGIRLDCVKEDLVMRYDGTDADVLTSLVNVAEATTYLHTLDRLIRAGLADADDRAAHARLQASLMATVPAISSVVGDLDVSSVFVALVMSAGATCWRQGDGVGVVGHA